MAEHHISPGEFFVFFSGEGMQSLREEFYMVKSLRISMLIKQDFLKQQLPGPSKGCQMGPLQGVN